jgi:hypothetical protein
VICFAPSLADSFIFLTLTRLVVVFIFVNFSFALFTPPLGDYHNVPLCNIFSKWHELKYAVNRILKIHHEILGGLISLNYKYATYKSHTE